MVGLSAEQYVGYLADREAARPTSSEDRAREGAAGRRASRRCSATRSATRSRRRWSAGSGGARSSGTSSGCYERRQGRGSRRARHLRQLPVDGVPPAAVPRLRLVQRLPRVARPARGLPRAPAEPRRRPAAADERDRARRACATARSAQAEVLDWQVRTAVRLRLRRRVRLLVDGRVAPRRARRRRLGVRPDDGATARRSPRCTPSQAAFAEVAARRPTTDWPRVSVVVCTLQRRADDRPDARGARCARLPGLRGDRRRRRLDRRDRRDRRRATASDVISHAEPRASSARGTSGWHAATGEIVAYIDDDAYPDPHWLDYLVARTFRRPTHAAVGGPNMPPPDDALVADARRARARRADPRAALGHRGRAHSRLQHGVPARRARGDRRLRPAVPRRRRRRRRLLAAPGGRAGRSASTRPRVVWHHRRASVRALPGASSAATGGPRRCSSASGRRSTTRRARDLVRAAVRERRPRPTACAALAHLPRRSGAAAPFQRLYQPRAERRSARCR